MRILVLNCGSSTFKCWFREVPDSALPSDPLPPQWSARADWSRNPRLAELKITRTDGSARERSIPIEDPADALEPTLQDLPAQVDVAGHRIVHGGPKYREPAFATAAVRDSIAAEAEIAPAHNRLQLDAIRTVDRVLGSSIPQVAVFDTGFHCTLEPAAYVYPGPYAWLERGIRRYGFHGISVKYATRRASEMLGKPAESLKLIVCHLGNGASLTAVSGGKSVDTSMGFTPLEGIMMGTRSGSIDPGIVVHLLRHDRLTADQLDQLLNRESGLKGVSGFSGDMREILEAIAGGNERARLAFDIYTHRLTRATGAMLAVLGGLDALVYTGGVGENCAPLRAAVCAQLGFMGLTLDDATNARPQLDQDIAAPGSRVRVLVIRAEEDWEIARDCHRLLLTRA
ncbi:MAG TPA: acetate/propionate family kinase [Bryobacteraceae bacterium]|nr:acetate/propionate family kinase [Bryobacteraceae bacterium]